MNEEEKKAIELLEYIRNNSWTTKYIMSSDSKNAEVLLNLIGKLQKENEELRETNKKLYETGLEISKQIYTPENYIPVQKVKDIIKEKEWAVKNYDCDEADYRQSQAIGAWNVLQKLIKESEE